MATVRSKKRGDRYEAQFQVGCYWFPVKKGGRVVNYATAALPVKLLPRPRRSVERSVMKTALNVANRIVRRLDAANCDPFACDADREEAVEIVAEEINDAIGGRHGASRFSSRRRAVPRR